MFPKVTPFGGLDIYESMNGGGIYRVRIRNIVSQEWVVVYNQDLDSLARLEGERVLHVYYHVFTIFQYNNNHFSFFTINSLVVKFIY